MRLTRSSNPVFNKTRLENAMRTETVSGEVMTVNGSITKTAILFLLLLVTASFSWKLVESGTSMITVVLPGVIGGLILALVTIFRPQYAAYTAPAYALFEGLAVGGISAFYASFYQGIVIQAVGLTLSILFVMLLLYRTGVLKATPIFRRGVIIATGGVAVFYILNMIFSLFGGGISLFNFGLLGIGIQLAIVVIASMNLILDFDNIEKGAQAGMPKFMEWYSGFGLMVTLVWLYLELLRLLALISGRR